MDDDLEVHKETIIRLYLDERIYMDDVYQMRKKSVIATTFESPLQQQSIS